MVRFCKHNLALAVNRQPWFCFALLCSEPTGLGNETRSGTGPQALHDSPNARQRNILQGMLARTLTQEVQGEASVDEQLLLHSTTRHQASETCKYGIAQMMRLRIHRPKGSHTAAGQANPGWTPHLLFGGARLYNSRQADQGYRTEI